MRPRDDLSTPEGVIAYFRNRAEKRAREAQRRRERGQEHPAHQFYAEQAREDAEKVRQLFGRLAQHVAQGRQRHG